MLSGLLSEYDVDQSDDNAQRTIYETQFPVFWEHPAVRGVTLWGYVQGEIWKAKAYLVRTDGTERPALQWLRSYLEGGNATSAPTPTPTPQPAVLFTESGGQVVMEAEHFTDYFPGAGDFASYSWVEDTSVADASGGVHMFASPNSGGYSLGDPNSPTMGYFVNVSTSGNYSLWVRRAAAGGGDDSCQISVDSGGIIEWSYGGSSTFDWIKYTSTFSLTSGAHVLKIGMREDGTRVDKVILTTNASYTPSGQGPAESPTQGTPQDTPTPVATTPPTTAPATDPTTAPTVAPTPAGCSCAPGDVNCSGSADIVDALLVAQYYVGLNTAGFTSCAGDVNSSGGIDIVDALLIAQYYVGLIPGF